MNASATGPSEQNCRSTAVLGRTERAGELRGLSSPRTPLPDPGELSDLEKLAVAGDWVVRPETLERGRLIELEVELEAEAVFRINAVVPAFLEIVHEDLKVFGVSGPVGITEARAMSRVLDKLLTGLVPL
ncbi:MAG: DUF6414 family protein [Actinomycetota bacterium]